MTPMPSSSRNDLSQVALRVLSCWSEGKTTDPEDVKLLRDASLPEELYLPLDELACRIVQRELLERWGTARCRKRSSPGSGA